MRLPKLDGHLEGVGREMSVTAAMVKELRERTGAGVMDCKEALCESGGDLEKATSYLKRKGISVAARKAGRSAQEGVIGSYIHSNGRIGVLVEVNCETDFVANTEEFRQLVKDLSMQIAATNPSYLDRESVPKDVVERERETYALQAREEGKPEAVIHRIVEGRLGKFFQEHCLLEQEFIRDEDMRVGDLLKQKIAQFGENIVVRRYVRFQVGAE